MGNNIELTADAIEDAATFPDWPEYEERPTSKIEQADDSPF